MKTKLWDEIFRTMMMLTAVMALVGGMEQERAGKPSLSLFIIAFICVVTKIAHGMVTKD